MKTQPNKIIKTIVYLGIVLTIIPALSCCLAAPMLKNTVTIMTYNTEAFFDDVDNGTEYSDYDPGAGKWNSELFREKCGKIAKAIKQSTPGGPDIVALQEIENMNTLDLLCESGLSALGYKYRVLVPASGSATNTALVSRIPVNRVSVYSLPDVDGSPMRKIVEAEINFENHTLYLFNNHWKSKSGGSTATEPERRKAAGVVISRIKEIAQTDPSADIIILGDLNENADEYDQANHTYQTALVPASVAVPASFSINSIILTNRTSFDAVSDNFLVMYEPWNETDTDKTGSYVFSAAWQTPDHIILSAGLFDNKGFCYRQGDFRVVDLAFLLDPETGYPFKWGTSAKVHGYSDHLPLLITLTVE